MNVKIWHPRQSVLIYQLLLFNIKSYCLQAALRGLLLICKK